MKKLTKATLNKLTEEELISGIEGIFGNLNINEISQLCNVVRYFRAKQSMTIRQREVVTQLLIKATK